MGHFPIGIGKIGQIAGLALIPHLKTTTKGLLIGITGHIDSQNLTYSLHQATTIYAPNGTSAPQIGSI